MDIKARIQQYLDYQGIKTATFEKEVGLSNGYWRKTKSVSANAVADILRLYSDLSAEWVFRGTGSMLLSNDSSVNSQLDAAIAESKTSIHALTKEEAEQMIDEAVKRTVKKYMEGAI